MLSARKGSSPSATALTRRAGTARETGPYGRNSFVVRAISPISAAKLVPAECQIRPLLCMSKRVGIA